MGPLKWFLVIGINLIVVVLVATCLILVSNFDDTGAKPRSKNEPSRSEMIASERSEPKRETMSLSEFDSLRAKLARANEENQLLRTLSEERKKNRHLENKIHSLKRKAEKKASS